MSIVNRHQALRTSFSIVEGNPQQIIHPTANLQPELVDLQHLPESARERVLVDQVAQAELLPFDLEHAPLLRVHLWQLAGEEYVCLVNMHHIVSDGWSMGIIVRELAALYSAYRQGAESPLPELTIQYADFALWQRQWLQGAVLEQQLNYWKSHLLGAPGLLQLPTDHPRPSNQTYRGNNCSYYLPQALTAQVQAISRRTGSTLFMTLLAGFATLMYRYSGQSDIVIGSPIANRNRQEIESLIGFFVNTLVLRTQLTTEMNFEQLLAQVRTNTLQAYEHQDVPFERVVETLQPERSLSHSPLFQVMFTLQNAPMGELELPGVTLGEVEQTSTIAKFDLTLAVSESEEGLACSWEYNTDLFDGSTIEQMASHFENLLSGLVDNPHQAVSAIPLLSEREKELLLVEWNNTATEYPKEKCIHQLFEEQVEKTPEAIALVFEEQQLTYRELNSRANQLAHYLQRFDVQPETLVGICIERSLEMVVGVLGILKAGAAYVPLDPAYPQERLSFVVQDAQISILLTRESIVTNLPLEVNQIVCLDSVTDVLQQEAIANLSHVVTTEHLAYVIYTSGSTGQPKGVMIAHASIVNRLVWGIEQYQLTHSDRVLQKTTLSFDVSVWEIFGTLLAGASLVLASPSGHQDPTYLTKVLAEQQITHVDFVPAMLKYILDEPNLEKCSSLRYVTCGGESLSVDVRNRFFEKLPKVELHNCYGPTEVSIDATAWVCDRNSDVIPIGRPIANTQIYILDNNLQPVPIGVAGELYIGGDGLARGYLNRPELTREKFIPDPFSADKSSRLYQTGDKARYLSDGNIEFIGRLDDQVKVRGFRIELGEVESVLGTYPQIQQAVVVAAEDTSGNNRLVAYVVTQGEDLGIQQLREFLQHRLPGYMVPASFVVIDTLPLTPNGKVDRKALPDVDKNLLSASGETLVLARDSIELSLAQIWSDLLHVKLVGIRDNFFKMGGHSLLAVSLMSKIQQQFQISLPLSTLFEHPTIEEIAHLVRFSKDDLPWSVLVPIKPHGNRTPLFCVHPGGGTVFCYQHLAYYLNSDQPVYGLQSYGLNPQNSPHTSVEQMATCYIQELKKVQPVGPYFLCGWSFGGLVAFEMAQQLDQQGEQIAFLAILDTYPTHLAMDKNSLIPEDDANFLAQLLAEDEDLEVSLEQLTNLTEEEQLTYVLKKAQEKKLFPEGFDLVQARLLLDILKINSRAGNIYRPQYLQTSLDLFAASDTPDELKSTWDALDLSGI